MNASFLSRLSEDYPEFSFRKGVRFSFRPPKTIMFGATEDNDSLLLLHELGHALCGHVDFSIDAERLKMEREAWTKAEELAKQYGVEYDEDMAEKELETYRCWLDTKSRCPHCKLTRYQTPDGNYHCPRCDSILSKS